MMKEVRILEVAKKSDFFSFISVIYISSKSKKSQLSFK